MPKNFAPNAPLYFGEAFEIPRNFARTYLSYKKGVPKNFAPNAPLYFGEAFEIPKDFSRKVLCVRVWGGSPNIQCTQKSTATPCFLFFVICWNCRSKPCFKVLPPKKHLKNPQKLPAERTTLFWQNFGYVLTILFFVNQHCGWATIVYIFEV